MDLHDTIRTYRLFSGFHAGLHRQMPRLLWGPNSS